MPPKPAPFEPRDVPLVLIDRGLYAAFAEALGEDWAFSYLRGAEILRGDRLLPRTETAWLRIRANSDATDLLRERGVTLLKPPPFRPKPAERDAA